MARPLGKQSEYWTRLGRGSMARGSMARGSMARGLIICDTVAHGHLRIRKRARLIPALVLLAAFVCFSSLPMAAQSRPPYPWLGAQPRESIADRFPTPHNFEPLAVEPGGFGEWLRHLPLLPGKPDVLLFDGRPKANQRAHAAVLDVDVGKRDLQQCADAVIRLHAEYLYSRGEDQRISYNFTSGFPAQWVRWKSGSRPLVKGNQVSWIARGAADDGYANFRRYLETVFIYAGSASLEKSLVAVPNPARVQIGDVFIQGGFPGHAVIVVNVAENATGERCFLLVQSYMPAQQMQVLKNPGNTSPWYPALARGELITPEWRFRYEDLRRLAHGRGDTP